MYVRIYKEKPSAVQSYLEGNKWILEVIPSHSLSYVSDLMHWNASYDMQKQIKLKFDSLKSAENYANMSGMKIIPMPYEEKLQKKSKSYLENFTF